MRIPKQIYCSRECYLNRADVIVEDIGAVKGFPHLICFKDGRTETMELKTERGRLGPRQEEWLERLREAGMSVNVFRPADWDQIEALLKGEAA